MPFQVENRFFVLISSMGFRNFNFSFFLSVFMCSGHFLVLSEHCQHKCEYTIKKTLKKNVGAPEFWCPGTRTMVPPMFLTEHYGTHKLSGSSLHCKCRAHGERLPASKVAPVYSPLLSGSWLLLAEKSRNFNFTAQQHYFLH